ncbi:sensor histidine kinase [Paenibacillus senegalimassiliensis]|uniref:sensor histidine kinase n=1 Tax=Paenibacillus senegalimassiliensis TaxID=1737426 RepID=UPI00073E17C3|nr:histidine kinase [Paenibacillus senegalimassiliensis]
MLNNWYQTFLKDKTLSKMVMLYSLIAMVTVLVLAQGILRSMTDSAVDNQMDIQRRALDSINDYVQKNVDYTEQITNEIYSQTALADNVTFFLTHTYSEYLSYRMEQITGSGIAYWDATGFFERKMGTNPAIQEMVLYGEDSKHLYHLWHGRLKTHPVDAEKSYVPGAIIQETARILVPNLWIEKLIGRNQERMYAIRTTITSGYNLKTVGHLIVYYNSDQISSAIAPYEDKLKGNLLVLTPKGQVIYDQSGQYYGEPYPYTEQLLLHNGSAVMEKNSWVNAVQNNSGFIVLSVVPKGEIIEGLTDIRRTIIILSLICVLIIILIPFVFVMNYTKQMHLIIRYMRSVETGELGVRIPIQRKDELGLIAGSFNQMLNKLTHHINRSYKAETEQSRAEMTALQARVNPHFLFNTLEVIRMRAVSLGVTEIGDMVYNLANLFRNLVEEETFVSLQQELENCRLYLELFKSRYQEDFSYEIRMDPQTAQHGMVKLSLQVLIENFIVHGLRDDDEVNHIEVTSRLEQERVYIVVRDNGMGIEEERLAFIRNSLSEERSESHSFGLRSVYQRLVYLYGDSCTLDVASTPGEGTTVTITMPYAEEEV